MPVYVEIAPGKKIDIMDFSKMQGIKPSVGEVLAVNLAVAAGAGIASSVVSAVSGGAVVASKVTETAAVKLEENKLPAVSETKTGDPAKTVQASAALDAKKTEFVDRLATYAVQADKVTQAVKIGVTAVQSVKQNSAITSTTQKNSVSSTPLTATAAKTITATAPVVQSGFLSQYSKYLPFALLGITFFILIKGRK